MSPIRTLQRGAKSKAGANLLILQEESVSVKIRLKKFGAKARPYYRIVVMDTRSPRDGKTIDEIGYYHPIEAEGQQIRIDEEKAKAWLAKGAQPSDTVRSILNQKNIQVR
jgi:small subunit ribosomal protein S16